MSLLDNLIEFSNAVVLTVYLEIRRIEILVP